MKKKKKRKIDSRKRIFVLISIILISIQTIIFGVTSVGCSEDDIQTNESIIFSNVFGGKSLDHGNSVQQTSDGGYIIVGDTHSYGAGVSDVWLIKTDRLGKKEWSQTFGSEHYDNGEFARETSDGGYIIVGFTRSYGAGGWDVWLIKTDNIGELQWDKTFGGTGDDYGRYVREDSDGGYLIDADLENEGLVLIKTDNQGNIEWEKDIENGYYSYQLTSDG